MCPFSSAPPPWPGTTTPRILVNSSGGAIAAGTLCIINGSGTVDVARTDGTEAQAHVQAIALDAIASGAAGRFVTVKGSPVQGLSGGTPGALGFLPPASGAGAIATTKGTAALFVIAGRWLTATVFIFDPSYPQGN